MKKKFLKVLIGVAIISGISLSSSTAYAWDGKEDGTGTHAMIVNQGMDILKNDLSNSESKDLIKNLNILKDNLHDFKLGSTFPDYDKTAYDLYQDHFWDPDTNNNFSEDNKWYLAYSIPDNAETQLRKFTALAKNEWKKGNYKKASFYLGESMHYFGDICTPYHAANVTAVDSPGHVKFETFAEKNKDKYEITTTGKNTNDDFYNSIKNTDDFEVWSKENAKKYAKESKQLYKDYANMSASWDDWDYAAKTALASAQKGTALYLYRFLSDVTFNKPIDKNVSELVLYIHTSDVKDAGTDDYMYFNVKTKDGKVQKWYLDNPGNDFERGSNDTYRLKLDNKNIKFSDIDSMYITKEKFTAVKDAVKLENVKVICNGEVKVDKDLTSWITDNKDVTIFK